MLMLCWFGLMLCWFGKVGYGTMHTLWRFWNSRRIRWFLGRMVLQNWRTPFVIATKDRNRFFFEVETFRGQSFLRMKRSDKAEVCIEIPKAKYEKINWFKWWLCNLPFMSHKLDSDEFHSTCGHWTFKECSRCGALETVKRPPPKTITIACSRRISDELKIRVP